jgi:anhydro-N-acetylmuramic acid kinase
MDGIDVALLASDGIFDVREEGGAMHPYDKDFQRLLKISEYAVKHSRGDLSTAEKNFPLYFQRYCIEKLSLSPQEIPEQWQQAQDYVQQQLTVLGPLSKTVIHTTLSLRAIITLSTLFHIRAILLCCQQQQWDLSSVDVIGYHGQTLYHNPAQGLTLQVGDAAMMATALGKKVVHSFRQQDVEQGGHGAPFAPIYHHALVMRDQSPLPVVVVNNGGIANVTLIQDAQPEHVIGFDTGPGNVLLDRFVMERTQGKEWMDCNGQYGLQGSVQPAVLQALYETSCWQRHENFYQKQPPKSLDVNDFLWPLDSLTSLSLQDGCATLAALTAKTIVESLVTLGIPRIQRWILAGGGWHNQALLGFMHAFATEAFPSSNVVRAHELGWNGDLLEAQLFAYLAICHMKGMPTSYPTVTGASRATVGGQLVEAL